MKILLVDDDTQMTQLLGRKLEHDNYVVEVAPDGEYAIDLLQVNPYSLVLLDVVLPKISGIEVCQTLREQGNQTPILMLTGQDDTTDKIIGLDAGADDYLVKPFELDELTARVRALLRRSSEDPTSSVLSYGCLQFDPGTQQITYDGLPMSLRPKELAILELMLRHPTRIFKPETLIEQLWNLADCPGKSTIKAHIRSLRKRLKAVGGENLIETLYGRGYRLNQAFLEEDNNEPQPMNIQTPDQPQSSTQSIVEQTWEQVQGISWNRLMRLQELVRSLHRSPLPSASHSLPPRVDSEDRYREAKTIAHQLKGTLGTFGFQAASLCAQHIEKQLSSIPSKSSSSMEQMVVVSKLGQNLDKLQNMLQAVVTDVSLLVPTHSPSRSTATLGPQHALIISRDTTWQKQLQQNIQEAPFPVQVCSPNTVSSFLLNHSPTVIVLDISKANCESDLSLLDALVSNYKTQVPILTIIESPEPEYQRLALEHGATAVVLKIWSLQTLISILNEYTVSEITQCSD